MGGREKSENLLTGISPLEHIFILSRSRCEPEKAKIKIYQDQDKRNLPEAVASKVDKHAAGRLCAILRVSDSAPDMRSRYGIHATSLSSRPRKCIVSSTGQGPLSAAQVAVDISQAKAAPAADDYTLQINTTS
ncbi:hypothetical protein BaRGS_00001154, partial [Batillaria attramentaria]